MTKCSACNRNNDHTINVTAGGKLGGDKPICTYCYYRTLNLFDSQEEIIAEWKDCLKPVTPTAKKRLRDHIQAGKPLLIGPNFVPLCAIKGGIPSVPVVCAGSKVTQNRQGFNSSESKGIEALAARDYGGSTLYNYLVRASRPSLLLKALGAERKPRKPSLIADPFA
jgi:hypothetical protein